MARRWLQWSIPILTSFILLSSGAGASFTHANSGTGGIHSGTTHDLYNPSHVLIRVKAPLVDLVTSGGRYHDGCKTSPPCQPAKGGDWALDINAPTNCAEPCPGDPVKFNLDYAGYGSGADPLPDNNRDITIRARLQDQGTFRNSGNPACFWQRFDILATYYGVDGAFYGNKVVGYIWLGHLDQATVRLASIGQTIEPKASRKNDPYSGTVHYINNEFVAETYSSDDGSSGAVCSTGSHVHVEVYSTHAWGLEYEWHSRVGPDGYNLCTDCPADHIHRGTGYSHSPRSDSTSTAGGGRRTLGFIGGGSTSFWMKGNPYYNDH